MGTADSTAKGCVGTLERVFVCIAQGEVVDSTGGSYVRCEACFASLWGTVVCSIGAGRMCDCTTVCSDASGVDGVCVARTVGAASVVVTGVDEEADKE